MLFTNALFKQDNDQILVDTISKLEELKKQEQGNVDTFFGSWGSIRYTPPEHKEQRIREYHPLQKVKLYTQQIDALNKLLNNEKITSQEQALLLEIESLNNTFVASPQIVFNPSKEKDNCCIL